MKLKIQRGFGWGDEEPHASWPGRYGLCVCVHTQMYIHDTSQQKPTKKLKEGTIFSVKCPRGRLAEVCVGYAKIWFHRRDLDGLCELPL